MIRLLIVCLLLIAGCSKSSDKPKATTANAQAIERVTEKGPVKLTIRISPMEPRLSDLIEMDVVVVAKDNVEVKPPTFGDAVGEFLVRDYRERTPTESSAEDENTRLFHYQLEPVSSGTHLIRSIAIPFTDNRESSEAKGKATLIESEPIEIKITTELGEQMPDLANLAPMLPPVPLEQSYNTWWIAAMGAGLAIVIAIVLWLRREQGPTTTQERQLTPDEIARAALERLLSENLPAAGLFKEFYVRLTSVVRYYIEGTTGLRAPEQTTEEFLYAMRSKGVFSAERSMRLKEFLEAADMVKYAGQQPGAEQIELSILRAREFVFTQQ